MDSLADTAPAFVSIAHEIVWCTAASVDEEGRPRSRVLHPMWEWDGQSLVGWIATSPLSPKSRHLARTPALSCTYWTSSHDTCTAECRTAWEDDAGRERLWERFRSTPPPLGYDPAIIPGWTSPSDESFGALRLEPWRLYVMPGSLLLRGEGRRLVWEAAPTAP
jgi:hypothetical protein